MRLGPSRYMVAIHYNGRLAAEVEPPRIEVFRPICVFENDHPVSRWVWALAIFAYETLVGHFDGPFTAERAALFALDALLPDQEFVDAEAEFGAGDDAALAEHFNVPVAEIANKRADLASRLRSAGGPPLF